MVGRYIKYNKSGVQECKVLLDEAYDQLKDITASVFNYVTTFKNMNPEKLYLKDGNAFTDTVGEWADRTFTTDFNWTDAHNDFKGILDALASKNGGIQNKELNSELASLKDSVGGLITLINDFDVVSNFKLTDQSVVFDTGCQVRFAPSGDSYVIYYTGPDGKEITLSQLLNCFYTYSGMAISSQLEGFIEASANSVPFDYKYQMGLLEEVNGTIDSLKNVGAFGVASDQNIINLSETLIASDPNFVSAITHDGNGNLTTNVGGEWTSNMEAGSIALLEYPLSAYVNDNPLNPEEPTVSTGPTVPIGTTEESTGLTGELTGIDGTTPGGTEESTPGGQTGIDEITSGGSEESTPVRPIGIDETTSTGPKKSTPVRPIGIDETTSGRSEEITLGRPIGIDETTSGGPKKSTPSRPTGIDGTTPFRPAGIDKTTPGRTEEKVPGGENPTVPTKPNDVELIDLGSADDFKTLAPKTEYDYDDLARQQFEGMSEDELLAFREQSVNKATGYIDANDVESISNDLTGYGYSQSDIDNFVDVNNEVVKEPDAVIAAYVAGDQNNYMADTANNMAKNDGVTDFTSSHGSNASYSDHENGNIEANIANMYGDENVNESSKQYQQAKDYYEQKAAEVNEAAEVAKEARVEVESKVEEYGEETSKWTEKQAKDYNEAKESYEQATENYEEKVEKFYEAEQEYKDAKDVYDTAKENFKNEIKENVKANEEFYENQTEEVYVSDEQLVEEVGGTGESNPNGDAGSVDGAGIAMSNEGDVSTAASETGLAGDRLATGGDTYSATGETSTEPNNGIDDLRNGVDTPNVETSGMDSQIALETAPASETGIITEDNTVEMADVSVMSEPQGMETANTEVTQEIPNGENSLNNVNESSNNDAAIAQQMAQEEAARNEKQKTESAESSDAGTQPTQTVQTATVQTDFRTDADVKVESSSNENVVSVGNDALLNSIITE